MNRDESLQQIGNDIVALIVAQADALGQRVVDELEDVAAYAAARADHLALVVGEPGFDQALLAERDSVVLRAAGSAVESADAVDARILLVAATALRIAATALRVVAV